jgi:NAD(P)-dependent dehydrogenase (short-subunit alcohol dehydrogenase family)
VLAGARDEARGLQAEGALREAGADARFVRLDVTDPKSAAEAADWVDREYGRLADFRVSAQLKIPSRSWQRR